MTEPFEYPDSLRKVIGDEEGKKGGVKSGTRLRWLDYPVRRKELFINIAIHSFIQNPGIMMDIYQRYRG